MLWADDIFVRLGVAPGGDPPKLMWRPTIPAQHSRARRGLYLIKIGAVEDTGLRIIEDGKLCMCMAATAFGRAEFGRSGGL